MESVKILLCLKDFLRRVKLLPCRFWMNRNIGNKTFISKHYIVFGDCKYIKIGKNCLIGMNSVILPGAILGDHVIVGANSTLRAGFYPSYTVVAGSPACIVKRYDFKDKIWKKVCKVGVDS